MVVANYRIFEQLKDYYTVLHSLAIYKNLTGMHNKGHFSNESGAWKIKHMGYFDD